jgi:hypothetical protein
MIANSQSNPSGETWSWQACRADGTECAAFDFGRIVGTGAAASGTVFSATSSLGATATSAVWHGNVSPATPPAVSGVVRANALVTPVPGTWNGGWDGDRDVTQLAACAGANGSGCTSLTDEHYPAGCRSGAAVIDPVFTGRYLRVGNRRRGSGEALAAFAVGSPYSSDVMAAGPTTAVAIVGPIGPSEGPRQATCGPRPIVCRPGIARSACITAPTATISGRGVARVRCLSACTVTLRAQRGRNSRRISRSLSKNDVVTVQFSRRALASLGGRQVRLRVFVDGQERERRTIKVAAAR